MPSREQQLNQALEAMHFGFRAMVHKPDQRLARLGYSRIHHRILYFIGRNNSCSINELLKILGVSKQYLNKPLKKLLEDGHISQQPDREDKRIRRLSLTESGLSLEYELTNSQRQRFARIFERVGPEAENHWRQVMRLLSAEFEF